MARTRSGRLRKRARLSLESMNSLHRTARHDAKGGVFNSNGSSNGGGGGTGGNGGTGGSLTRRRETFCGGSHNARQSLSVHHSQRWSSLSGTANPVAGGMQYSTDICECTNTSTLNSAIQNSLQVRLTR